jgi:hypothetical protein
MTEYRNFSMASFARAQQIACTTAKEKMYEGKKCQPPSANGSDISFCRIVDSCGGD